MSESHLSAPDDSTNQTSTKETKDSSAKVNTRQTENNCLFEGTKGTPFLMVMAGKVCKLVLSDENMGEAQGGWLQYYAPASRRESCRCFNTTSSLVLWNLVVVVFASGRQLLCSFRILAMAGVVCRAVFVILVGTD